MIISVISYATISIFLAILFIFVIKVYEAVCYANVKHVETKAPIKNRLSIWQSIMLLIREPRKPLSEKLFELTMKFENEPFMFFFGGWNPTVVFSTPHAAKTILIDHWKDFDKNPRVFNPHQEMVIGKSLVVMNGKEWKTNRLVMNPSFQHVEKYLPIMSEKIKYCCDNLKQLDKCSSGEKDTQAASETSQPATESKHIIIQHNEIFRRLTLDIIGLSAFDYDFNFLENMLGEETSTKNEKVLHSLKYIVDNVTSPERVVGGKLYTSLPIVDNHRMMSSISVVKNFLNEIVERKKLEHLDRQAIDAVTPTMETVLDSMIESVKDLEHTFPDTTQETEKREPSVNEEENEEPPFTITKKNLFDNVILLFLAGHATTANALSFLLYNLASNRRVQEKLVQELRNNLPEFGNTSKSVVSSPQDLERLTKIEYLDWVVNENLRMYPPAGFLVRLSNKTVLVDHFKIPKGHSVTISVKGIHYNPDAWGNQADSFLPERFNSTSRIRSPMVSETLHHSKLKKEEQINIDEMPERTISSEEHHRPVCSFIPFGTGARGCLGSRFSIMEQKIFISQIISKYVIELPFPKKVSFKGVGPLLGLSDEVSIQLTERLRDTTDTSSEQIWTNKETSLP